MEVAPFTVGERQAHFFTSLIALALCSCQPLAIGVEAISSGGSCSIAAGSGRA